MSVVTVCFRVKSGISVNQSGPFNREITHLQYMREAPITPVGDKYRLASVGIMAGVGFLLQYIVRSVIISLTK